MPKKLWGGRFSVPADKRFERFSSSLPQDWKLGLYDLRASEAHCRMLARTGILRPQAARKILKGLQAVRLEFGRSAHVFAGTAYEDIHSWIESRLLKHAGPDAERIHAGRSRNDQVNQACRMYIKDHAGRVLADLTLVGRALLKQAKQHRLTAIAGMTHLQKAQPVLLAHVFLSYIEALSRSAERISDAARRADVLTLGSGALAGSSLPLDRAWVQKNLGFSRVSANSLDAVGSRDFIAEWVCTLALLASDFSRIAEDLLWGHLEETGVYVLPESLCTGSSMMPQKKNADFLE
ncbi:MAG: argininosuccinate lyase, partial [Candidatus Omnitrophica bacterium]|nr:argininosuccinate lyase [Candidatus Omnitrophota bacterium]